MDVPTLVVTVVLALGLWMLVAVVGGCLWFLFSTRIKARGGQPFVVAGDETAGPRLVGKATRADADLAAEVAELAHKFKLLSNEWADKEGRMDSLIKRVHRLLKVEQNGNGAPDETSQPPAPLSREQLLAVYQARQAGKAV